MKYFAIITLVLTSVFLWMAFDAYRPIKQQPGERYGEYTLEYTYNMDADDFRPVNIVKIVMIVFSIASIISMFAVDGFTKKIVLTTVIIYLVSTIWTWGYVFWFCRKWIGNGVWWVPIGHTFFLAPVLPMLLFLRSKGYRKSIEKWNNRKVVPELIES